MVASFVLFLVHTLKFLFLASYLHAKTSNTVVFVKYDIAMFVLQDCISKFLYLGKY